MLTEAAVCRRNVPSGTHVLKVTSFVFCRLHVDDGSVTWEVALKYPKVRFEEAGKDDGVWDWQQCHPAASSKINVPGIQKCK